MEPSYFIILLTKVKLSITVDEKLIKWIDSQVRKKKFANRSHAFEYAVANLLEEV